MSYFGLISSFVGLLTTVVFTTVHLNEKNAFFTVFALILLLSNAIC